MINKTKPKHKKASVFLNKKLFTNLSCFSELENRISKLPSTERGDAFEVFAEAYFKTQALHQAQEVWPDNELPQNIRYELGLPPTDKGIDGVFKTHDDKFHAYQVKYRTNRLSLSWDELSTFMGLSDKSDKRVLFTNSNDISSVMNARTDFYSIKGNDLDRLDQSDFLAMENWLKTGSVLQEKKSPYPHQSEAINDILKELNINDRATAIMACGTGKTLVALWVAEKKDVQTILVLLPSLALVRQTLHDWAKENSWNQFNYLCVCSDKTVDKNIDETVLPQHDLDFTVTTQKEVVEQFLQNQKFSRKIIFSTYQSCQIVAQAMPQGYSFDLAIFDEAHKTASRQGANYAFALQDKNLSIKKRLFLTATPRHYNINKKDKEGDLRLVFSMDDTEVYGQICHKLSFAQAAKQGIICKYKVVISLVVSEEVDRERLKHGEVIIKGDLIKAQRVANLLALTNAVERYGVKKIFTFHNAVKAAQSFTANSSEGISTFLKDFRTFHVNGKMQTSKRELLMTEFKETPKAVMSNARCLTEGVDVPDVDMVAFISPKKSKIDIVQATGRAMRKPKGSEKEYGYILIPIYLELASGENIEQALEKTQFDDIWNVLQTLQEYDENLVEIISQMREEIGRTGGFDDSRLREKIEVLGREVQLSVLRTAITTKIVEQLSCTWDERFGELLEFKELYGNCNIPQRYKQAPQLGEWVAGQRKNYKKGRLSTDHIKKLESLRFVFDVLSAQWDRAYEELCLFQKKYGHCNVTKNSKANLQLSNWIGDQRKNYKKGILSFDRIKKLDELGLSWSPVDEYKGQKLKELSEFKSNYGHCNVPQQYKKSTLGKWLIAQRIKYNKGKLDQELINQLSDMGVDWNPIETLWEEAYQALCEFKKAYGHCIVSQNYTRHPKLGNWVSVQRNLYSKKKLSKKRISKLSSIGFVWHSYNAKWEEQCNALIDFKAKNGHCYVPQDYANYTLMRWVRTQQNLYKKNQISIERIEKLKKIDFCWDDLKDQAWENKFSELLKFKSETGHCNVPLRYPDNAPFGSWVSNQRGLKRKGKLSEERQKKLEEIGFIFEPLNTKREQRFIELSNFKQKYGNCNVPATYKNNPGLGSWVSKKRIEYRQQLLDADQVYRLEKLGFVWEPRTNFDE